MVNFKRTLRDRIDPQETSWSFSVHNLPPPSKLMKSISAICNPKKQEITISLIKCPANRVVPADPVDKFLLISFADFRLRYPSKADPQVTEPATAKESAEFIFRILRAGITINNVCYNFYGHSNSQLKSRSCFLFAAPKEEISRKVAGLGDFSRIKTVAKKAKRIGLLFSTAEIGLVLPPERCEDIADIQNKDYTFTDGCGLISVLLAKQLVKQTDITFRNKRYTPSVLQIRYRGYKGVLTVDPSLRGNILAQFRDSMRKFKDATDLTLSVVDYSKPYAFGFLNDEVIVLLHALGISSEVLHAKQSQHLSFLSSVAALTPQSAFQYLCFCNQFDLAERLLIDGLESVRSSLNKLIREEYHKMLNKREEQRCRIFIQKSRLLFGVCDPRGLLREGECFVRITAAGDGLPRTLTNTEVLVTRNPCLHPGDLQKFRAVEQHELSHLVDCIVFPTRGKRPSADLMSGGDLDGDKFFVSWDPELIPSIISEPAEYPGVKEPISFNPVTDDDRIQYFARYTSTSLGQVKNLYLDWARLKGPMSPECQQLNRLFSQCVDGNRIKIPEFLKDPPRNERTDSQFILDSLHNSAKESIRSKVSGFEACEDLSFDAMQLFVNRDDLPLSEIELIQLTVKWCQKNGGDIMDFLDFFDFNLLTDEEKAWFLSIFPPTATIPSLILNGLLQSNILDPAGLMPFKLQYPGLRWKCTFDTQINRMGSFLDHASQIIELFHKKLIVLHVDERLALAVFIPKKIERHKECLVDSDVRVFAFPQSQGSESSRYRVVPTKVNYRLYCDNSTFQLYERSRANTWIFLTRGPVNDSSYRDLTSAGDRRRQKQKTIETGINFECRASVALNKISSDIQRHVGSLIRRGILGAEVYVISNRDVEALRTLDLWLEYIDTQKTLPLFENTAREYHVPTLRTVDWSQEPTYIEPIVKRGQLQSLDSICSLGEIEYLLHWLLIKNERVRIRTVYDHLTRESRSTDSNLSTHDVAKCLLEFLLEAPFAITQFFSSSSWNDHKNELEENFLAIAPRLLRKLVLSANTMASFALEALKVVLEQMKQLDLEDISNMVEIIAMTSPSPEFALDVLLGYLQPQTSRLVIGPPRQSERCVEQLYGIALDHIDEATESKVTWRELFQLKHKDESDGFMLVECQLRIDSPSRGSLKAGDHVRFRTVTAPQNAPCEPPSVIDAIVEPSAPATAKFRCFQRPPPFFEDCSWELRNCGSFVSSKAMLDATLAFHSERAKCCNVYDLLAGVYSTSQYHTARKLEFRPDKMLNESQNRALEAAMHHPVSLLWGPPGTGKTHTIVAIIRQLLKAEPAKRLLVTAPTHNAVDNVLRKLIESREILDKGLVPVRVSTDIRKVSDDLRHYTCDAMMGKDLNTSFEARRRAQKRIRDCRIVFTTCIGSSLGLLRSEPFQIVLIDEASQQTEATSLVPLVKGCERAILVGDHVQLRATVGQHAKLLDFDVSLFERLYCEKSRPGICKVMLNRQYRMHSEICSFSSTEFYEGALETSVPADARPLPPSKFPWPNVGSRGDFGRKVFVQCSATEDLGRKSKSNQGQATLCREICNLLTASDGQQDVRHESSVVVLTPYTRQIELLRRMLPGADVYTIDGYQGREADIVIFVTVRCNAHREMGFLKDMRRLNVVMTRAKAGLIIIGDKSTLSGGDDQVSAAVWERLIASCTAIDVQKLGLSD